MSKPPRILTVHSHVSMGHVGNAAILLPLQRLGIEVLPVHTVLLSNHKGYADTQGTSIPATDLRRIVQGLDDSGNLAGCNGVLAGYLPDEETGAVVLDAVATIRRTNANAIFCCDPVIGDDGRTYVDGEVVDFVRNAAIPAANIVTPNHYELGVLVGQSLHSRADLRKACDAILRRGPDQVLVTSVQDDEDPPDRVETHLYGRDGWWQVTTPRLRLAPTVKGAGDLTAALFIAHLVSGATPVTAMTRTVSSVFAILNATAKDRCTEMNLLGAQDEVVGPSRTFSVEAIS